MYCDLEGKGSGVVSKDSTEFRLECVITSVGHADILAHTLPMNRHHFDKLIIVTAPEDKDTVRVCDYYGVKYHATDSFQSRWGHFCKGKGINEGLAKLDKKDWILHLDSDIVLPPHFRSELINMELDKSMIYGVDRYMVPSYKAWQQFIGKPDPHRTGNGFFIDLEHAPFPLGTRVAFGHENGWIPIGFFQLWNAASGQLKYEEGHTDAGREDSVFPIRWPRSKRGFLPEILTYHLESELSPMGTNWKKRQSKPFSVDSV